MPTSLQYKPMLCQKVMELDMTHGNFDSVISLSEEVRAELKWWVQNLQLRKGRPIFFFPAQYLFLSDSSLEKWVTFARVKKERVFGHYQKS